MKLGKRFLFSRKYRILTHCTVLSFITKSAQFRALIAIKASFLSWFILNIALKSEHDMTNEHPIFSKCMAAVTTKKIDRSYWRREESIEPGKNVVRSIFHHHATLMKWKSKTSHQEGRGNISASCFVWDSHRAVSTLDHNLSSALFSPQHIRGLNCYVSRAHIFIKTSIA